MSPPDLEKPVDGTTDVRSPGALWASGSPGGSLHGTPGRVHADETEHLPGLRSQGPHSVLGFIPRNHQVLTRERKEKKGKETT